MTDVANVKLARHERVVAEMKNFDSPVYAFDAKPEEEVAFEFIYEGEEVLQSIKPGCGCTDVSLAGNIIAGKITVGKAEPDTFSKYITVYFDDGEPYCTENDKKNMVPNPLKLTVSLTLTGTLK